MIITGIEGLEEPNKTEPEEINWTEAIEKARAYKGYGKKKVSEEHKEIWDKILYYGKANTPSKNKGIKGI